VPIPAVEVYVSYYREHREESLSCLVWGDEFILTESAKSFIRKDLENEEIEVGVEVGDAFGRLEKGDEMAEGELTGLGAEM
jgi:hypothetical protein